MMSDTPTVYVVDDDPGALKSLCWLIEQAGVPVRAFQSGREFLEADCCRTPGCLVLDVRMPEMSGLEVQQQLARNGIGMPIIFLTAYGDVASCVEAFKAGAVDYLEKPVDGKVLLVLIHEALARGAQQKEQEAWAAEISARIGRLTPCEKEVMHLLVAGKTIKEIAGMRSVRMETIWKHRTAVFIKMKVDSEVELVHLIAELDDEQPQ